MDWRERDRRLDDIFERYVIAGRIGLRDAIEALMEEDRNEAYEDGAEAERECYVEY